MFTHNIARSWVQAGHSVTLFCSSFPGGNDAWVDGVEVIRRGGRLSVYREAPRFYGERSPDYDLVVDEINSRPFFCPRFVQGPRVVAMVHQVADEVWRHHLPWPVSEAARRAERRWLKEYRHVPIAALSVSTRESLISLGMQRVWVTAAGHEPVDPSWCLPKATEPTLIFVGRLVANKRPHDAIEAFALARRHIPNLRLAVVGTGPLENRLRSQAPEGVEFLGWVPEEIKFGAMSRAHALVSTSAREGWGLVVTEAASVGTPTIAYDVAGLRDSVGAAGGTLVRASPRNLAAAIVSELPALSAGWMQSSATFPPAWSEVAASMLEWFAASSSPR